MLAWRAIYILLMFFLYFFIYYYFVNGPPMNKDISGTTEQIVTNFLRIDKAMYNGSINPAFI